MAYPGAEERHLRSITFGENADERELMLIQEVLFARNNIVKAHLDYAKGDFSSLIRCMPKNLILLLPILFPFLAIQKLN